MNGFKTRDDYRQALALTRELLERADQLAGLPMPDRPLALARRTVDALNDLMRELDGGPAPDPNPLPVLKALVVEDNLLTQKLLTRLLGLKGHACRIAENGQQALEWLSREPFDLVLMDLRMPVMDGWAATTAIRDGERRSGRHLPIIAVTALTSNQDRERALDAGMDGFQGKPIQADGLFAEIDRVLSNLRAGSSGRTAESEAN
ncbi:MAG: response regulator, partial [Magnetococcales bacterium]|nr:response regulator [Magnetococcales bacterium]